MIGPSLLHRQAAASSLDRRRKEEWKIFALLWGQDYAGGRHTSHQQTDTIPNYLIRVTRTIADPTPCCPVNTERQYSVLSSRAAGAWADGLAPSTTNRSRVYWLAAKEPLRTPHRPAILAVGAAVNTGRQYSVLTSRQLPRQRPRVHPNPRPTALCD